MTEQPPVSRFAEPAHWVLPAWPWTMRVLGAASLLGAEILHVAGIGDAYTQWWVAGLAAAAAAVVEGLLATLLVLAPSRACYWAAAVTGLPTIAVALVTGSVGLPFGPDPGTAVVLARPEVVALTLVGVAVVVLAPMADNAGRREAAQRGRGAAGSFVAAAVMVVAVSGLVGFALTPASGPGPHDPLVVTDHAH